MQYILERIAYYKELKGWNEYQLAEKAGMTQSTISTWYRKDITPTIPSLEKICNAFGITLSQFFAEEEKSLEITDLQKELVIESSRLSPAQQDALLTFIKKL